MFSAGDKVENVYIVVEGEFRVFSNIPVDDSIKSKKENMLDNMKAETGLMKTNQFAFIKNKEISLFTAAPFDILGEGDILAGNSTRSVSCVCSTSTGKVLIMNKRDFRNIVLCDKETRKFLSIRKT